MTLESLVPEDHLLRHIDAFIDFEFIRDKVRPLYCIDNGRPATDPVVLFKLLFIGLLCGIRSEGLEERDIYGVIGYRRLNHKPGYFYKREYHYDAEVDVYICPAEQRITYNTSNRDGYREYKSDPRLCKDCPLLMQCTRSKNHVKVITRHVWQDAKERIDQHRKTPAGKKIYARRKETVERSF